MGDEASQVLNISDVMEPRFARFTDSDDKDPVRCCSRARKTRSTRSCGALSQSHRSTSSASKSIFQPITLRCHCPSAISKPWKQEDAVISKNNQPQLLWHFFNRLKSNNNDIYATKIASNTREHKRYRCSWYFFFHTFTSIFYIITVEVYLTF